MVASGVEQHTGVLRKDLSLFPGGAPGQWTLFDPIAERYFRLDEREHAIVSLLYESVPLPMLQQKLLSHGRTIELATLKTLLEFLSANNLLLPVYETTEKRLKMMQSRIPELKRKRLLHSLLFLKIPLLRPDGFLDRTWPALKPFCTRNVLLILLLPVTAGYLLALMRFHQVTDTFLTTLTTGGMLKYGLTISMVKIIHELAHAYAAKSAGVRVRTMGIGLMVFLPRLYSDITDSWQIGRKSARMLIDGAGMGVEILIGGLAALIWANTGPGAFNSACYYLFAVSAISTLLVNGNPLLRFDGYYLLMDATGIDNLSTRSAVLVRDCWRKYLFGIPPENTQAQSGPLTIFLLVYGICSFLYRLFLYTSILITLYHLFTKIPAIILILLEIHLLILQPLTRELKQLYRLRPNIQKGNALVTLLTTIVLMGLFIIPLPWTLEIPCEIGSVEESIHYAPADGYLETIAPKTMKTVRTGDLLFTLVSPELEFKFREMKLELALTRAEEDQLRNQLATLGRSQVKRERIETLEKAIEEIGRKINRLQVRAETDGALAWFQPDSLVKGRLLTRGVPICEIFDPDRTEITAWLPEQELDNVRAGTRVAILLPDQTTTIPGIVTGVRTIPITLSGPSPLLDIYNGPVNSIPTDHVHQPLSPYYSVTIQPASPMIPAPGRTGIVKIRRFSSMAGNLIRFVLQIVRRDILTA